MTPVSSNFRVVKANVELNFVRIWSSVCIMMIMIVRLVVISYPEFSGILDSGAIGQDGRYFIYDYH